MNVRGIRGAITADANTRDAMLDATRALLGEMVQRNNLRADDIAAVFFSCTGDLTAAFPAEGARQLGWSAVPLFSASEIDVPEAVARCIRILVLWNTSRSQGDVQHVYLRGAAVLRPDLHAGVPESGAT